MATTSAGPQPPVRRPTTGRWAVRAIGVLVLWVAWTFLVGGLLLLTGNLGTSAGRVVAVAATLLALVPTWFLVRAARRRWWLMAGAALVLVALGLGLGRLGGPSLARMTGVGASLPVATGAQLLTTSSVEHALCLHECSRVTHLYAVADAGEAQAEVGDGLVAAGWRAQDGGGFCRDGFGVTFANEPDPSIVDPPAAPPGMELLSVETSRCD
ncbi:hypothetical protein [Cellulomonas sp. ICMP 17802]|uniref:hypothetical protein n=1 Tax=Cellulomonas sp. ICMP 17802 TaxID=3239199 RepID=UPI00351BC5DE